MINERLRQKYPPGTVAIFQAGVKHAPVSERGRAVTIEGRHYKKIEQDIGVLVRSHQFFITNG